MGTILIIDDDRVFCDVLSRAIGRLGHNVTFSLTLKSGLETVSSQEFDIVMLDVQLPDGNGLTAISKIREEPSPPEVIIITGSGDRDGAELAIKWGAWDYVEKPASVDAMTLPLIRALEYRKEKQGRKPLITLDRKGLIGDSDKMQACLDLLAQAANSDVNVLITGETGTGKELLAKTIHKNSPRAKAPLIVVDCSALPESLVESILFGHEKGAFTGADRNQPGLISQADRGTLFLDEVGELPLSLQKTFLRVLQEHHFRPVGGKNEEASDFRLVAATNRNLYEMVASGQFRNDLLYRLRTIVIESPPLRQRPEDIKDLAMYHVGRFCEKSRIMMKGFSPDFFEVLKAYRWPGNVRELFNALDSVVIAAQDEPILYPYHLPAHIRATAARASFGTKSKPRTHEEGMVAKDLPAIGPLLPFKEYRTRLLENGEKGYFNHIALLAKGDAREACGLSGLSRSRLYYFLQKHNISLSNQTRTESNES